MQPALRRAIRSPLPVIAGAVAAVRRRRCCCSLRLGQEFVPTLDEKNIAMQRCASPARR